LNRIEALESIYNYDLSANILPEIFSKEMWEAASVSTTFDRYFFSHYKVYYSIEVMLEYFSDDRIWGIALPIWSDNYITSNAHRLKAAEKKLFFFTPTNGEEVARAVSLGADGIYADSPTVLNSTP